MTLLHPRTRGPTRAVKFVSHAVPGGGGVVTTFHARTHKMTFRRAARLGARSRRPSTGPAAIRRATVSSARANSSRSTHGRPGFLLAGTVDRRGFFFLFSHRFRFDRFQILVDQFSLLLPLSRDFFRSPPSPPHYADSRGPDDGISARFNRRFSPLVYNTFYGQRQASFPRTKNRLRDSNQVTDFRVTDDLCSISFG